VASTLEVCGLGKLKIFIMGRERYGNFHHSFPDLQKPPWLSEKQ